MSNKSNEPFLIWEDEGPGSQQWWLSRAHEPDGQCRELYIAEDSLTGHFIGVARRPQTSRYKVFAAIVSTGLSENVDALQEIKTLASEWINSGSKTNVWQWRFSRWSKFLFAHLPIAFAGFGVGGALGLLVAFFGVSSGLVGWPMLVAGLIIGAGAGPVLKFLVDRRPHRTITGPWVRFTVITFAAVVGAATMAGGFFALFWGA